MGVLFILNEHVDPFIVHQSSGIIQIEPLIQNIDDDDDDYDYH